LLEPQSAAFFPLLIVVFVGLMWWMAVAKQVVFRVLAACLAFLPAMAFGVAAVNKYYDYYQNWLTNLQDCPTVPPRRAWLPRGLLQIFPPLSPAGQGRRGRAGLGCR